MLRNTVHGTQEAKIQFARTLRKNQTPGEKILWKKLRAKRFSGFKFRRQVSIGPYIADFLCVQRKLIIEIDGDSHFQPGAQKRDRKREDFLRHHGFSVLRFGNRQTVQELETVVADIAHVLGLNQDGSPLPNPLPRGEGTKQS